MSYTVAAITGNQRYGQTRYAVEFEKDEPESGELLKRSYVEPGATEQVVHTEIFGMYTSASVQRR